METGCPQEPGGSLEHTVSLAKVVLPCGPGGLHLIKNAKNAFRKHVVCMSVLQFARPAAWDKKKATAPQQAVQKVALMSFTQIPSWNRYF